MTITNPLIKRVKEHTIHNMYCLLHDFKSSVTIWLKSLHFGNVVTGLGIDFLNFWHTLHWSTTFLTVSFSCFVNNSAFEKACNKFSLDLWFNLSCIFLIDWKSENHLSKPLAQYNLQHDLTQVPLDSASLSSYGILSMVHLIE